MEAILYQGKPFDFFEIKDFVGKALIPYMLDDKGTLGIETLEGLMRVSLGDYVIRGISGEFYPCKPDIFEKTYELAEEAKPQDTPDDSDLWDEYECHCFDGDSDNEE